MAQITREHAENIAGKLEAVIESGRQHDLAKIYQDGKKIAQYGIRRGSKKDTPHSYLPEQLHVTKAQCLDLARCPLSRAEWIEILEAKGVIDVRDDPPR
jgi:hypothetical protein